MRRAHHTNFFKCIMKDLVLITDMFCESLYVREYVALFLYRTEYVVLSVCHENRAQIFLDVQLIKVNVGAIELGDSHAFMVITR